MVRGLLSDELTTVDGPWFNVTGAICEPKPVQERLPLLVGAKGERMLGAWSPGAPTSGTGGAAPRGDAGGRRGTGPALRRDRPRPGVDPPFHPGPGDGHRHAEAARAFMDAVAPRAAVAGPPEGFADRVAEWAAAGVDEVIVPIRAGLGQERLDQLDALHKAVAPMLT